ncbi:Nucleotide-diphospho-sugar transferase, partial [Pleurotus pulmonarius]
MVKGIWVTLLTGREKGYMAGISVLASTLRSVGSEYPLAVMATVDVPQETRTFLKGRGIVIIDVEYMKLPDGAGHTTQYGRFNDTWTKLRVFDLHDYERAVFLDSDMIVMRNMDELMQLELPKDWIAAAHTCACNPYKSYFYPEDCTPATCGHTAVESPTTPPPEIKPDSPRAHGLLNSGLVVLTPSQELFTSLSEYFTNYPDFSKFRDQELLAEYFQGKWKPLN